MSEISVPHGRTFDENIDILFDEIVLAAQWGRPSLLLAVHKSRIGQDKGEQALETLLTKEGFAVERIVISDGRFDIAALIRTANGSPRKVFFISNIDWGGGEDGRQAYRALNLHRELFVDEAIKAVFWLTTNEAANLPRFSPDFWAFRHRVVEFVSQRAKGKVQLPAGILAWDIQRSPDPFDSLEAGILAREDLLRKLPDTMESLSTKVEIHASLGYLQWMNGEDSKAMSELDMGMRLAKDHELPELMASLLNGLGNILYERGEHEGALGRYNEGLHFRSLSRVLLINRSAALCMLGRIQESLAAGKRAIQANPSDADTWRRWGHIQTAVGKPDEAIESVLRAMELAPRSAQTCMDLAVIYSEVERPEETRALLNKARELGGEEVTAYAGILEEAMLGEPARAAELLKATVAAGRLRKHEVRRDVNLGLLFEAAQIEEALA